MFHRATVEYSPILHVVIRMRSSDHERQLAKITTEVGSSSSSPGVLLHEWLDEDSKVSKKSLNDEERINRTKTQYRKPKVICKGRYCVETLIHVPCLWEYRINLLLH